MITDKRMTEMQEEMFNIIGNMKLLKNNKKYEELGQYIDEQYEILKKELSDDDQSDK
jgi:dsDNA-binding SOS-regulon protein